MLHIALWGVPNCGTAKASDPKTPPPLHLATLQQLKPVSLPTATDTLPWVKRQSRRETAQSNLHCTVGHAIKQGKGGSLAPTLKTPPC